MSRRIQLSRRVFLRTAGMTALAGAAGTSASLVAASPSAGAEPPDGVYDFDEIYDRTGTACSKWDAQIEKYGRENIEVAMGVADMDFRCAPAVTRALQERCQHENWGYGIPRDSYIESIVAWNKNRHGVEVDPDTVRLSAGVHPALIAALKDNDALLRVFAAKTLHKIDPQAKEAVPALTEALADKDWIVRKLAQSALDKIKTDK